MNLDRKQGWDVIAGYDKAIGHKVTRFMLAANTKTRQYAILTADGGTSAWSTHMEGDGKSILKEWDKIDFETK